MKHSWIGVIVSLAFAAWLLGVAVWSAKTGRMPTRGGMISKVESPLQFKVGLWLSWALGIVFLASAVIQVVQMVSS